MAEKKPVHEAWAAVMADVQSIAKSERNKQQGFDFRGVDTVVNAVGPATRKHGVLVTPKPLSVQFWEYETRNGTSMRNATVDMAYTITGPDGDSIEGGALGEASDAGDKAVSKAQSVAYRVFLLQALCIPTDEPDPDSESHERAGRARRGSSRPPSAAPPAGTTTNGDEFKELAAKLDASQRGQMKAWRIQRGFPEPSQMTDEQKAETVAQMRELLEDE